MTVSIRSVDDEADVAEPFRQHFRREVTQGSTRCTSWPRRGGAADAGRRHPQPIDILSDINMPAWMASACCARSRKCGRRSRS